MPESKSNPFLLSSLRAVLLLTLLSCTLLSAQMHNLSSLNVPAPDLLSGEVGLLPDVQPKVSPEEAEFLSSVAVSLQQNNYSNALAQFSGQRTPNSSAAIDFAYANIAYQTGNYGEALAAYDAAIRKYPAFRRAHKNLGVLLVMQERFSEARAHLARAIELGEHDAMAYGLLGFSALQQGDTIAAETAYRGALLQQPNELDWREGLAQALAGQGREAEVIALVKAMIEQNSQRPNYWMLLANSYLSSSQEKNAIATLELQERMGLATQQSLFLLGDLYVNQGYAALAASAYQRALSAAPDPPVARVLKGTRALLQLGATGEARALLQRIDPQPANTSLQYTPYLNAKAQIAYNNSDYQQALKISLQAVEHDPLNGEALLTTARAYRSMDDPERAEIYFERAQKQNDVELTALTEHARLLIQRSRYHDAAALLRQAQRIHYRESVAEYLKRLENFNE